MNVYLHELRSLRLKTVAWTVAIVALMGMYFSVYPAFSKDADTLRNLFNNLPDGMEHIMGIGQMEMFSFLGFMGNVFPFITLVGAIQATTFGLSALSKEGAMKMSDFLLTKPLTRRSIFWQKVLAGATILVITQVAVTASAFIIAAAVGAGSFSVHDFLLFWGAFVLIQFWFYAAGLLISQLVKKLKTTAPLGLGLSFGFFLLAIFAIIIGDESIRWLTPFRFIDYRKIVTEGAYDMAHVLFSLALTIVFACICYFIYTRKDVPSAI